MFHPCVANRYEPRRVCASQRGIPLSARAIFEVPCAIAVTRVANAQAKSKEAIILLVSFVFIVSCPFLNFFLLFRPSLPPHREESFLAVTEVFRKFLPIRYAEICRFARSKSVNC